MRGKVRLRAGKSIHGSTTNAVSREHPCYSRVEFGRNFKIFAAALHREQVVATTTLSSDSDSTSSSFLNEDGFEYTTTNTADEEKEKLDLSRLAKAVAEKCQGGVTFTRQQRRSARNLARNLSPGQQTHESV